MPLDLNGSEFDDNQNKSYHHSHPDTINSTNSNEYRMDPVYNNSKVPGHHLDKNGTAAKPILRPSMQTIPENPCETRTRIVNGSDEKSMESPKLIGSGIKTPIQESKTNEENPKVEEECSELFPCQEEEAVESKPERVDEQDGQKTDRSRGNRSFHSRNSKKTLKSKKTGVTSKSRSQFDKTCETEESQMLVTQIDEDSQFHNPQLNDTERSNMEDGGNNMTSKFNSSSMTNNPRTIITNGSELSRQPVPSPKSPHFQNSLSNRSHHTPRVPSSSHKSKSRSKVSGKGQSNEEKTRGAPKPRITSGNRIRPGERLPSAKSKASPTENSKHRQNVNAPNYVRSDPQEIALLDIFSECESKLDRGAINIFCSKSDWLECSFMLSDENPSINIQSFHLLGGSLQQVTIPLTPEQPMLCRIFFEVQSPTDTDVSVLLFSCGRWIAIRLAQYVRNCRAKTSPEGYCDLALCNLSTGTIMPTLAMLPFRPQVSTGLPEIRRLVSFIQNSKFGAAQFFGFDPEHVEQKEQEYLLSALEARTSMNSYEIGGDLSFLLGSLRRDVKKNISLTLLQRAVPLWKQIAKETADFDFEQSFEEEEDFDQMDSFSDQDPVEAFAQDFN